MAARSIAESHLDLERRIRARAHQIYLARGSVHGFALDHWLQAEREILGDEPGNTAQDRATVVGSAAKPGRELTDELGEG